MRLGCTEREGVRLEEWNSVTGFASALALISRNVSSPVSSTVVAQQLEMLEEDKRLHLVMYYAVITQ